MSVTSPSALQSQEEGDCAGRIGHLPADSFALFVLDFAEPLIIRNQPILIIGRENTEPDKDLVLDMSRYGDLAQGISRQHAQILFANGEYSIEDLGSTNGTWLNRNRLTPGQAYGLHNNDQVWLGPLKLLFCRGQIDSREEISLKLRYGNTLATQEHMMSPGVLLADIATYLQAMEQLEGARSACLQETAVPIFVTLIEEKNGEIQLKMVGVYHVAGLIQKWVTRWRDEHLEMVGADETDDPQWQERLRPLATRIAEFLQPTMPASDLEQYIDPFIPPLARLVTSPFEFSLV